MSSIFLAHSSADKRFVRRLAADLAERGVRVWFDEAEIGVGDSLVTQIEEGIGAMDYLGGDSLAEFCQIKMGDKRSSDSVGR